MPESEYPFVKWVGQIRLPNWASSEYRNQKRVELDERPFPVVLAEQQKLTDLERPLEYDVRSLLRWFREMDLPQRGPQLEPAEDARALLLAHLAEAAQLALGATLFILQEREEGQ